MRNDVKNKGYKYTPLTHRLDKRGIYMRIKNSTPNSTDENKPEHLMSIQ